MKGETRAKQKTETTMRNQQMSMAKQDFWWQLQLEVGLRREETFLQILIKQYLFNKFEVPI